jgi:hypothetical protein
VALLQYSILEIDSVQDNDVRYGRYRYPWPETALGETVFLLKVKFDVKFSDTDAILISIINRDPKNRERWSLISGFPTTLDQLEIVGKK